MVERHDKLYGYVSEKHCVFYEDHLPNPDGLTPVVTLSDYSALEAQLAELAAENERLKREVENWKTSAAGWQKIANVDAEALASTGAVKALDEDDYEEITNAAGIAMRSASRGIRGQVITIQDSFDWWVMKETERRILSSLDNHPRATNTVVSHKTGNVVDKIERDGLPRYQLSEGAQERISLLLFEFSATSDHARVAVRLEDLRLLARLAGVKPHKVD